MPAVRPTTTGAVVSGWGTALPDRVVTNDDFAARMDTSDEWIRARTGISERRFGGTTTSLSVESGRKALAMAELTPERIDGLIVASCSPDLQWGTAAMVQNELGLKCGAIDLNAACTGFIYSVITAHGLLSAGADRILVIGTDTMSRITDQDDRTTAPLFGDGSGAIVLESVEGPGHLLSWDMDADGSAIDILQCDVGGKLTMEGKEVFRRAVRFMVDSATKTLDAAGVDASEVKCVVPHQANIRIIDAACERLGIPSERAAVVIDHTGNTSSASIPLALAHALDNGQIQHGDLVLLVGFGGGMTVGSCLIRWGGDSQ